MKKTIIWAGLFVALATGSAAAADLNRGYYGAPAYAPPPPYSWVGPYIGANLGFQWGEITGNPTEPVPGQCSATRRTTGTWSGGYQSEVVVKNTGDVPMLGWMVDWTLPSGQKVDSLWSGSATYSGQNVMVHNANYNGSLAPGATATFGYVVQGSGGDSSTTLPCRVG